MDTMHCSVGSKNQNLKNSEIISVKSVPPIKQTEPRQFCQVLFNNETENQEIHSTRKIEGCYKIVLYYKKVENEEHDWSLTGRIVESLAKALVDHPLLAGRLRQRDDDITSFEIVSNDSGIRLLEAHYPSTLYEFLELNKNQHDLHEVELVFWNEIDAQFPQFSPLFYVQVTNFKCGGYSIGISCSLLLADVLLLKKFLNKWSQIYMLPLMPNQEINTPIFNYPRQKNPKPLQSEDLINQTQSKNKVQSVVFKITTKDANFSKNMWRELAMICIEEAEKKLDIKICSSFNLVVKESLDFIEVERFTKSGYTKESSIENQIISITTWNEFGMYEVVLHEENKPLHVSSWIGSVVDAHVMVVPCLEEKVCDVIIVSPS